MSTFQYVSDLHLEHYDDTNYSTLITPNKYNYLILAGDICPLLALPFKFLKWCQKNFKKTFYIPGNHEYWGLSIKKGDKLFNKLCQKFGIIGLNNQCYEGEDFRIIGSTLWSEIPEDVAKRIGKKADYKKIRNHKVSDTNNLHIKCRSFISNNLQKDKVNIVVTHHGPIRELCSAPKFRGQWSNVSYSSNCTDLVSQADYWIFGHTHFCINFWVDNCEVMSNCRGYRNEKTRYDKGKNFNID